MKKIKLIAITLMATLGLSAQTIGIDMPRHAGKKITLTLKQGTKPDTIYHSTLDVQGKAHITKFLPRKDYQGMANLTFENGAGLDFIVANESPTVFCNEEYPHGGNVTFNNSPENQSLQRWFMAQAIRQQKTGILKEAQRLYEGDRSFFYSQLSSQIQNLEQEQKAFSDTLKTSPLYAAKFIGFYNYLSTDVAQLLYADSLQMAQTRAYVCDSLDVENLFTSGLWFDTLNGLLALYDNKAPYHTDFINDMALLLGRCKYDKTYRALAENLFAICEATGWNDLEEQLAYFLINDGRIANPTGRLQLLMTLFKLSKGSPIPQLTQGELPKGKRVIVFYETGCNSCENEMLALQANYPIVKQKGYEVVSISSDTDKDVFANTARNFPWTHKYCDLKGFDGDDFRNFGVIGTPTFYVVNEKGIVQGRYARFQDTGLLD